MEAQPDLEPDGTFANAVWKASADQATSNFGFSVSTAGDVNGDGFSDIIASAFYYDDGETDEGKVFVWYGGSSSIINPSGLGVDGDPSNADWTAQYDSLGRFSDIA